VNPTAYSGHTNSIEDPELRALAWLGNLNYWCMLSLLDTGYRGTSSVEPALAQALRAGAWILLERDRLPFVLAGIERRGFDGQECFIILEFCVTGASRVSFWERAGPGEWDFLRDTSVAD
jgi:hypothetical protein